MPARENALGQCAEDALRIAEDALVKLEQARQGAAQVQMLLDTAPDAMVVVGDGGRITYANAKTLSMFGYARAELVGQRLELLIPERFRVNHDGHVAHFFSSPGARPMGSGLELFGRRQDGTELPIEVSLSPLRTERGVTVSAAIRDISERKRMESSAKLGAERLASAVENIQDAFALFDPGDHLVLCNSAYRRLIGDALRGPVLGASYERVLDAWMGDILFADDTERARFRAERLGRRQQTGVATFDLRMRDGRYLRVVDRPTPEGGIVKTIWDLTEEVVLSEALRQARVAAETANSAKSEFLSSMSHELRTPLNAILGFGQLLQMDKKEPLSDRHRARVEQILRAGEHLLRLIDDILDLSRIEARGIPVCVEPLDVLEVLERLKTTLGPTAAKAGISLEITAVTEELPLIAADRTRFTQILMNFGSNAIKYNRPGGKVTFVVSTPAPGHLRVAARDTGIGIPDDKQDKIFQPFQRAGQEVGPIEGTGIGLVITKRLAQLMQGDVGFSSVPGQGSEFWVDVPLDRSRSPSSLPPPVRDGRAAGLIGGTHRILYIEDNPGNVSFMRDLLNGFDNVELVTAPTAEIGLELARGRRPSVVIMDINLPGLSGLDALRALREVPETKAIPVLALTAAASARDEQRGMEAGFHRYLTKPVEVEKLVAALNGLLGGP